MNIITWPGSKQRLLGNIIKNIPDNIETYIEPFVGSGAVFLHLLYNSDIKNFIINDLNPNIFFLWRDIRDYPQFTFEYYEDVRCRYVEAFNMSRNLTKEMYNKIRQEFNRITYSPYKTALFIFLTKTCMNGLWRTNKSGEFNQTCGLKCAPELNYEEIKNLSLRLKDVKILYGDYHRVTPYLRPGVFVYIDPPYKQTEKTNDVKYVNGSVFDDDMQQELKKFCDLVVKMGGHFIQSNSDNKFFDEIYSEYNIQRLNIQKSVSANANYRHSVKEVLISG